MRGVRASAQRDLALTIGRKAEQQQLVTPRPYLMTAAAVLMRSGVVQVRLTDRSRNVKWRGADGICGRDREFDRV